ncbi:Uncharacterized protein Adt_44387 [Abeliophyllum distichum]|uniref:Uncharacterized protein n=1 Tax=Abeliophyllum distichum TaxID=126358 RepID=A0ABD1PAP3_9LAMI
MSADGPCFNHGDWETICKRSRLKEFRLQRLKSDLLEKSTGLQHQHLSCRKRLDRDETPEAHEADQTSKPDEGKTYEFEDLEMLMSEIGNMRSSLRLMPDFQRRENRRKTGHENGCNVWG